MPSTSSRSGPESTLAVGIEFLFCVKAVLAMDPCAELVAVNRVGVRDASVPMLFDVLLGVGGIPCPPRQLFEPALPIGAKSGAPVTLRDDPLAERIAMEHFGGRDASAAISVDGTRARPCCSVQAPAYQLLPVLSHSGRRAVRRLRAHH